MELPDYIELVCDACKGAGVWQGKPCCICQGAGVIRCEWLSEEEGETFSPLFRERLKSLFCDVTLNKYADYYYTPSLLDTLPDSDIMMLCQNLVIDGVVTDETLQAMSREEA